MSTSPLFFKQIVTALLSCLLIVLSGTGIRASGQDAGPLALNKASGQHLSVANYKARTIIQEKTKNNLGQRIMAGVEARSEQYGISVHAGKKTTTDLDRLARLEVPGEIKGKVFPPLRATKNTKKKKLDKFNKGKK